jgi:regulator of sigma E protease
MLVTLAAFLVVIGVLIFVHELGHFLVAKMVGVQVLRFSLGFGRPLLQWRRGETEYWISWIPLGGYVKMAGLEDEGMAGELEGGKSTIPIDPARAFDQQPVLARMAVIVAGVTMNVLLAFVIYVGVAAVLGLPRLAVTQVDTVATRELPPGAEALATLARGGRVVRVNGDTVRGWYELVDRLAAATGEVRLEVAGRPAPLVLHFAPGDSGAGARAAGALAPLLPTRVGIILPGKPAARAGLRLGDVVVRAGGDTLRSWNEMLLHIWNSPGRELPLVVLRGDSLVQLTVVPESTTTTTTDTVPNRPATYGFIGADADPPTFNEPVGFGRAVGLAASQTLDQTVGVIVSVKRLVLRQASVRDLGGPILIAQVSGQAARLGLVRFLTLLAFVSISLAVLNMLPIPVLDGGQAVFLIAEAVRRKPLSLQVRIRLTQVGLLVILGIIALAITNDVLRNVGR